MNPEEARLWLGQRFDPQAVAAVEHFATLVVEESARQNLIATSTLPQILARHVVDSAQLLEWATGQKGDWLDIGTGAGLPGMVIAILSNRLVTMVEPRRKRVEFLHQCIADLKLGGRAEILHGKVETVRSRRFAVLSARAVAPLPALLQAASHCATPDSLWLLPKGRNAVAEVAVAQQTWHGAFHVEHSITDPESLIVVAKGVRRR